ncbi:hypothetical protein DJICPGNB_11750 [Escherichia coli]|nr:hypothetical protein DJICPGNB_11750 [Escherichia coli]
MSLSSKDHKKFGFHGRCAGGVVFALICCLGRQATTGPIDVWIPGCPPTPAATIHGFAVALGLLQQKIHAVDYRDPTGVTMQPLWSQIPPSQCIAIEREARRLAGYRQGREICDRLLRHLSDDPTGNRVNCCALNDLRLNSIVSNLRFRSYMADSAGNRLSSTL